MLNVFYMAHLLYGGWATYTAHLMMSLGKLLGPDKLRLLKVGNRTEPRAYNFGYGLTYQNVSREYALTLARDKKQVCLIAALCRQAFDPGLDLLRSGARIVVHDCDEMKNDLKDVLTNYDRRIITIRDNRLVKEYGARFIIHPYVRMNPKNEPSTRKQHAISTCRIDFDKHTEWLLEANEALPTDRKIVIHGYENRAYAFRKIMPRWPNWKQSKAHYPREVNAAFNMLHAAAFAVDMSEIKGDGGGSQYSFLEAMDAGAVCVLNDAWFARKGEMVAGKNCLSVGGPAELVKTLKARPNKALLDGIVAEGFKTLRLHDPIKVAKQYLDELNVSY